MRRSVLVAAVALGLLAVLPACEAFGDDCAVPSTVTFKKDELRIQSGAKTHPFTVEMAVFDDQRARGLMCRTRLGPNEGMLFDFGHPADIGMWMKNTLIPLDMIFIRADGTVARIAQRTVPHSLATVSSGERILGVLEVAGGTAERLGLKPGDKVLHRIFKTAP
jgi:uncharacterized membrane protein (UPF0127 family)